MSFLKKLGMVLAGVASTALGIGPIVAPLLGGGTKAAGAVSTFTNDLTLIGSVIAQVETIFADRTAPARRNSKPRSPSWDRLSGRLNWLPARKSPTRRSSKTGSMA